jgi:hypothetical protein
MTSAHEQLYLRTLRALVATGVEFCVIGTFALRLQCPTLPRRLVGDCDLMLPSNPATLTELVQQLQHSGWEITLWNEPIQLPLTVEQLAGKYYLRARQAGAMLDCSYENDYLTWDEFTARTTWHQGLPLLPVEDILRQKLLLNKPAGQEVIRWYQEAKWSD